MGNFNFKKGKFQVNFYVTPFPSDAASLMQFRSPEGFWTREIQEYGKSQNIIIYNL